MSRNRIYISAMKKNIVIDNPDKIDIVFQKKDEPKIKITIPMRNGALKRLENKIRVRGL